MKLDINVFLTGGNDIKRLERWLIRITEDLLLIKTQLQLIEKKEVKIMAVLDPIKDKVAAMTTVIGSVKTLLESLSQMLKDAIAAGADPAEIAAIAAELDAKIVELADAVVANTPA